MHGEGSEYGLLPLLILLGATVAAAPLARRVGLSVVIGYLAAGIIIGPFGFHLFRDPATIISIAELGIVMLLFLIGLELKLSRLKAMRRVILGFGALQLIITTLVLIPLAIYGLGLGLAGAIVASIALAISATSIALQTLEERGDLQTPYGQRTFAVLLFQDIAVVPILALIPLLSPWQISNGTGFWSGIEKAATIGATIAAVFFAGRYLVNPLFQLLARANAREVMTAAALLLVIGTGFAVQQAGMSMGLGAFLAGLVLAESSYRHELEADIEPFRGLLLAIFFMGVGMSIDIGVVRDHWEILLAAAVTVTLLKTVIVWAISQLNPAARGEAWRVGALLTPAGEFAFVLIPLGLTIVVLTTRQASLITALAGLTMLIGPPFAMLVEWLSARKKDAGEPAYDTEGLEQTRGSVLIVGFGNAVNLTDGLDGLATFPVMIASLTFLVIVYLSGNAKFAGYLGIPHVPGAGELAIFAAAIIGACLAFLWFNAPPAAVFMGDTGSLALGGALATVAVTAQHELVLVLVGGLFVVEALSVIIQVFWYKRTGKRVFRMAPIHHHFEQLGWPESTVVIRFWIVSIVLALAGLATLKLR